MVLLLQKFVFYAMAFLCCVSRSSSLHCVAHDEFRCLDEKKCIPYSYRCDGIADCDDSSDESGAECKCPDSSLRCPASWGGDRCLGGAEVCDGYKHCSDGSDERNCGNITSCKVNEFLCVNGQKCIPMRFRCNGQHNSLCKDKSDNRDCADAGCPVGQLGCDSGGCLRKELFCDGRENCADGSDEKNCGYEDSDILFTNEGPHIYAKKKTKAGLEFSHLLHLPHRVIRTGAHNGTKITGLAFDAGKQILFISDASGPAILAVHLPSSEWVYLVNENIASPMDVAFDWSSNNLYWLDSGMAEVISMETHSRTFIIRDLPNPVSLALSPTTGTMFIATTGFESHVFMYGMDGKNKRILDSVQGSPASLAVHPTRSILYWTDPGEGTISYINYSSSSPPKILRKNLEGVMSVTVTEQDYYFTSGVIASGRGKNPGYEKVEGWKSITSGVKPSGQSVCLFRNGGCEFLCLTSEVGRSCACPPEETLLQDGKTCIRRH